MRRNYGSNVTRRKGHTEFVTEETPPIHEGAYFRMGDTEMELLTRKQPTEEQVQALFGHPQYRYEKARLKELHNKMVDAAFDPQEKMSHDKREGIVLGLRYAWALPNTIYAQAQDRARREQEGSQQKELDELLKKDYPDFEGVDTEPQPDEDG